MANIPRAGHQNSAEHGCGGVEWVVVLSVARTCGLVAADAPVNQTPQPFYGPDTRVCGVRRSRDRVTRLTYQSIHHPTGECRHARCSERLSTVNPRVYFHLCDRLCFTWWWNDWYSQLHIRTLYVQNHHNSSNTRLKPRATFFFLSQSENDDIQLLSRVTVWVGQCHHRPP